MWYKRRFKKAAFDGFGGEDIANEMATAIQGYHADKPPKFEGDEDARIEAHMDYNQNVRTPALIKRLEGILNARGNFHQPITVTIGNIWGQNAPASYQPLDHSINLTQQALYSPIEQLVDLCEHEFSHAKEYDYGNKFKQPGRQNRVDQADWDRQMKNYDQLSQLRREEYKRLQDQGYYDPADTYDPYNPPNHDSEVDYYNMPTEVVAYASNIKNEIKRLPDAARAEVMAAGTNFQNFVAALKKHSPTFQVAYPNLLKESLRQMVLIVYNALFNPRR